ncbi:MAG TPA: CRISPR-associated endoribonuclease Cas6 [Paludibacter sp.]|nr:CRISPR-associated endoribonuclease Cas6 [Paludibacter sp.]
MRLHLKIDSSNQIVPFDHQPLLVGTIHKWLGMNNEHGEVSLYSFSRLDDGKPVKGGLKFGDRASFFISSYDEELIKKLVWGIQQDKTMFCGLAVREIVLEQDPDLSHRERFFVASPIFIKRRFEDVTEHILYTDERAPQFLKETLQTKMKLAGMDDDDFEICFDATHAKAGLKLVNYKGVQNKANWCSVIIKGSPAAKLFAWNVGLGNSTGIGFGAIR